MTSKRIKEIVEAENIPNIEFIPMRVFFKMTDELLADMWVINVFNWKDVFDFEKSDLIYSETPFGKTVDDRISCRFGNRRIVDWYYLKVNVDETRDGLFLAKGPSHNIWNYPFISKPLADKIMAAVNPSLPLRQKLSFSRFSLNGHPDPEITSLERRSDYSYAGWTGAVTGDEQ